MAATPHAARDRQAGKSDRLDDVPSTLRQSDRPGAPRVREGQVHPAVLVEVEDDDADGGGRRADGQSSALNSPSRGLIQTDGVRRP